MDTSGFPRPQGQQPVGRAGWVRTGWASTCHSVPTAWRLVLRVQQRAGGDKGPGKPLGGSSLRLGSGSGLGQPRPHGTAANRNKCKQTKPLGDRRLGLGLAPGEAMGFRPCPRLPGPSRTFSVFREEEGHLCCPPLQPLLSPPHPSLKMLLSPDKVTSGPGLCCGMGRRTLIGPPPPPSPLGFPVG